MQPNDNDGYCCMSAKIPSFHFDSVTSYSLDATSTIIQLYQNKNDQIFEALQKCRLNPILMNECREDLEYYIPQLINYLVFRNQSQQLIDFLYEASQSDFFFGHLVYFQLNSLSEIIGKVSRKLNNVIQFLDEFNKTMQDGYGTMLLVSTQQRRIGNNTSQIFNYGTSNYDRGIIARPQDIFYNQYSSIYSDPIGQGQSNGWDSTILFWDDLITISKRQNFFIQIHFQKTKRLHLANPQIISLKADISRINQRLPAGVYVPFVSQSTRNYVVLNIVTSELRVFATKERCPFYICIELYRPDAEVESAEAVDKKLSMIKTITNTESFAGKLKRQPSITNREILDLKSSHAQQPLQVIEEDGDMESLYKAETPTCKFYEQDSDFKSFQSKTVLNSEPSSEFKSIPNFQDEYSSDRSSSSSFFGENLKDQTERIRRDSPFGQLRSWRLVHLIVKSGDNLKQEQFAMQILQTINQIFIIEKLPLRLVTYEVLSLGPSCGLIEMVKDAITVDSLKKNLFENNISLREFFSKNFNQQHLENFLNSLVAYSLACYIMQLKDRHNGNILLRRDGFLVHIDFGFFLGNAPGKGIEFEKSVPFKLLTEHIEVLGGLDSQTFDQFRKLFYRGFQALRRHADRILILVSMMYSGHGTTMPCFQKGDRSVIQLKERFYLDEQSDAEINVICQNLINQSIDNWRARWYDKYQYYFQGIFY